MKHLMLGIVAILLLTACKFPQPLVPKAYSAVVYKTPTCGCCNGWIRHLEANGFTVTATNESYTEIAHRKEAEGITEKTASCHTAKIGGYVVEGHVPAAQIIRLLKEKPDIRGLAVAGMPIGSPGMEGAIPEKYDVLAIHKDGTTSVWATVVP